MAVIRDHLFYLKWRMSSAQKKTSEKFGSTGIIPYLCTRNRNSMEEKNDDFNIDELPPMGPFSDEEAIARIDDFERRLAKGEVKWVSSEEVTRHLYEKYPWLR